jgi:hypothetical protein
MGTARDRLSSRFRTRCQLRPGLRSPWSAGSTSAKTRGSRSAPCGGGRPCPDKQLLHRCFTGSGHFRLSYITTTGLSGRHGRGSRLSASVPLYGGLHHPAGHRLRHRKDAVSSSGGVDKEPVNPLCVRVAQGNLSGRANAFPMTLLPRFGGVTFPVGPQHPPRGGGA